MKKQKNLLAHFVLILLSFASYSLANAQTSILPDQACINCETNDPSAVLEIESTTKGMLVPRMTTIQRIAIATPANGLLVFDETTGSFWFNTTASGWEELGASSTLSDTDADTKIQTEKTADEDIIRFDLGGTERWVMQGARLEPTNTGASIFIGEGAGYNDDLTDNLNTAVGHNTLYSNTTGSYNTAIGGNALIYNTTGSSNTANGHSALLANTTGSYNTAIGGNALRSNATGFSNTANGYSALYYNTTGSSNTAIGNGALYYNTTGYGNTAIGRHALYSNSTGISNTANGVESLFSNTTGSYNTANGRNALHSNTTGYNNTTLGQRAGFSTVDGSNNVLIGQQAGFSGTSLTGSLFLGHEAGYSEMNSNRLYIENSNSTSPLIYGEFDNDLLRINGTLDLATHKITNVVNPTNDQDVATKNYVDASDDVNDADASTTNEIQMLSISNNELTIDNGGNTIDLTEIGDADGNTRIQTEKTADEDIIRFDLGGTERWVMIGARLEPKNTGGSVFIGEGAGANDNLTDNFNTAVGDSSLYSNTAGTRNTANGNYTLYFNTTGSDNTALGSNAGVLAGNLNNTTTIGYSAVVDVSNKVLIGNSSVSSNGGQVTWTAYSDNRMKDNVQHNVPGLEFIKELKPVTYHFNVDKQNALMGIKDNSTLDSKYDIEDIQFTGFLAQEVQAAAEKVGYDFSGVDKSGKVLGLRYAEFVVPLVKAVQQMSATDEKLKMENEKLKEQLENVEANYKNVISDLEDMKMMIAQLQGCCVEKEASPTSSIQIELGTTQNEDVAYLEQNAPNPFYDETIIKYYLPKDFESATMHFTDWQGRNLKSIQLPAAGEGTISISAKELAAGTYAYTLVVDGNIVDTKKMILTR